MKLLPSSWPSGDEAKAVGFFAQAALELVHEKSWESYKLQTLSPLWRMHEVRVVSTTVIKGILPFKALEPIVDEANSTFCADQACKLIFTKKEMEVEDLIFGKDDKPQDLLSHASFLHKVCAEQYREVSENLLVEECFGHRRRSNIYSLLSNYFSHLVLEGHSREFIEEMVRESFFNQPVKKVDKNTLRWFFKKFPTRDRSFRVFGEANPELVATLEKLIEVNVVNSVNVPRKLKKDFPPAKGSIYFSIDEEARDRYSAGYRAAQILEIGIAVLVLFPSDGFGVLPNFLYVTQKDKSEYISVPSKPKFSRRILSHSAKSAARHMERVESLLINSQRTHRLEEIIGSDFLRAVITASLADNSSKFEVKLLTLWAAFEALLPLVPDSATNRISHFIDYIVPAVCLSYARDCFVEFSRDAERLHHIDFRNFLDSIPGELRPADKVAAVVINGSIIQKEHICSVFRNNPLALYRLKNLEDKFSSPANFERTLGAHSQKVKWQVQRIYRERNTVMHNGQSSPFVRQLLSNCYFYFQTTFTSIETVSKSYGGLSTVQSLSAIRKLHQSDFLKLRRAKAIENKSPIESQAILLDLVSGHFRR
ncbi:MAG: hypothetical protein R3197_15320 [Paracoccaceae bacterium]|nr:hypothetical protein [Paracoccaceae bacterium]